MPNPSRPSQNSKSFNPDKGLPLVAKRPGQAVGKGAAKEVCKEYQVKKGKDED